MKLARRKSDSLSVETVKTIETLFITAILIILIGGYVNDKLDHATKQELAKIDELLVKK